ncbi:hypothetical protein HK098_004347 [Nowakowskiella sp. JEL0407]|nr:hypothetical protein HK098_004347 [Nowakowskiella sp. JEL0407]
MSMHTSGMRSRTSSSDAIQITQLTGLTESDRSYWGTSSLANSLKLKRMPSEVKVAPESIVTEKVSSSLVKMDIPLAIDVTAAPIEVEVGPISQPTMMAMFSTPNPDSGMKKVASIKARLEDLKRESSTSSIKDGKHFVSMELLNSAKITSTQKETFALGVVDDTAIQTDLKRVSKKLEPGQTDFIPQAVPPEVIPNATNESPTPIKGNGSPSVGSLFTPTKSPRPQDIFGIGAARVRKHTAGSVDSNESETKSTLTITESSSYGTLTSTTITRKTKGSTPTLSNLNTGNSGEKESPMLASPSSVFSDGEKKSNKGFKEWYLQFSSVISLSMDEPIFPDTIPFSSIFGSKTAVKDSVQRILWAGKCFDRLKRLPNTDWQQKLENRRHDEKLSQALEILSDADAEDVDVILYRVLDIFKDGKLDTLNYSPEDSNVIISAPIQSLLDALIFPLGQNNFYTQIFLATFRFYLTPAQLLKNLVEWYNVDLDEDYTSSEETFLRKHRKYIQSRSAKVLLMWVKNHWQDFMDDTDLMEALKRFMNQISQVSFGDHQKLTQAVREQRLSWYTFQYIQPFPTSTKSPFNFANTESKCAALVWEPVEFAQQLTYLTHFFFAQLRPDTYLRVLKSDVSRKGGAHNQALKLVLDYASFFRSVHIYITLAILREEGSKKRTKALKRIIKIAKECRVLRNYDSIFAIVSALKSPQISSLHSVWENQGYKYIEYFKDLCALCDPVDGYARFWTEFKTSQPPAIPFANIFAGVYMQDILEVHENSSTFIEEPTTTSTTENQPQKPTEESTPANTNTDSPELARLVQSPEPFEDEYSKTINFQKFHDLFAIIAEFELFRGANYTHQPLQKPGVQSTSTSSPNLGTPSGNHSDVTGAFYHHIQGFIAAQLEEEVAKERPIEPIEEVEEEPVEVSVRSMKRLSGFLLGRTSPSKD